MNVLLRLYVVTLKHETSIAGSERSRMLDRRIRDPPLRDTARILIVEQARTKTYTPRRRKKEYLLLRLEFELTAGDISSVLF